MVRLYGKEPYQAVLVHGGPGAVGSLRGFAEEWSRRSGLGVAEALQSKASIKELVEELGGQIGTHCAGPVSLIGHSWGGWLAALFAEKHPEWVKNLILVGCGPLEDRYVPEIASRRLENLSEEGRPVFQRLLAGQATEEDMARLPEILEKSDNDSLIDKEKHRADRTDPDLYQKIWSEAARLRTDGALLASFQKISCKIVLIQGALDPHPAKGVVLPLRERGVPCEVYLLEKCGHSPFMERYAQEEFYRLLTGIVTAP